MEDGSFTALIKPSSPLYNIFVVFMYEYLGLVEQKKHLTTPLIEHVFSMQKSNGALAGYPEGLDHPGISTAGYVAAKIAGFDENDSRMMKLEKRIKEMGGPMKSGMLTMPFLMMFSLSPIHSTFNIGIDRFLMNFSEHIPWVKVLLNPVLFMLDNGHNQVLAASKYPQRIFKQPYAKYAKRKGIPKAQKDDQFLRWALEKMNPDGTFFDYTPTTVSMLMALSTFPNQKELISKGIATIESFQQVTKQGYLLQTPGEASIGETFYVANALLDVGFGPNHPTILKAEKYLVDHQQTKGGWGFSKNSIHFADSDDTSNAMYLMIRLDKARGKNIRPEVFKALKWMLTLQNKDGGFGTWENTKGLIIGNLINKVANKRGLVMSESVFEHTARIVVCLSTLRETRPEAEIAYKRALKWVHKQQHKNGSFAGTWFIDYMFSTSMAITALATDDSAKSNYAIRKGLSFLSTQQAPDGGFGESPESFLEGKSIQLEKSSWAQTGLIVSQLHTMNAISGCKFKNEVKGILDTTYLYLRDEKDKWTQEMDQTWTAVTFPKVEYLIYPIIQKMVPWQAYNMYLSSSCR
jgi:squalene cyclase